MDVSIGMLGKHPAFGDFVSAGFELDLKTRLMEWLDRELSRAREAARESWEPLYDHALPLRFWIGPELLGVPMTGILVFSRDRVNRRYPLVLAILGSHLPPPVIDDDQGVYEGLETYISEAQPERGAGAASLLAGIELNLEPVEEVGPMLWAHHPDGDLSDMLSAVAGPDLTMAAGDRSYWWSAARAGKSATFLSYRGLPPADALSWLMAGIPGTPPEEQGQGEKVRLSFETAPATDDPAPEPEDEPDSDLPPLPMPLPGDPDTGPAPQQGG